MCSHCNGGNYDSDTEDNMSDLIQTETRFDDAADLISSLRMMQGDASLATGERHPVVYVMGPDGTQFSTATLHIETLSDGSKVAHIILSA